MDHLFYLRKAFEVSKKSREHGNTPFVANLEDGEGNILLEQENIEITESNRSGHAETSLMIKASKKYSKDFLWNCTLYSTAEPCAMCAGAIYWGNVGKVVYGISEKRLLELTGDDVHFRIFDFRCREVFARGQKDIKVEGPFPEVENEVVEVHKDYWNK